MLPTFPNRDRLKLDLRRIDALDNKGDEHREEVDAPGEAEEVRQQQQQQQQRDPLSGPAHRRPPPPPLRSSHLSPLDPVLRLEGARAVEQEEDTTATTTGEGGGKGKA